MITFGIFIGGIVVVGIVVGLVFNPDDELNKSDAAHPRPFQSGK